jgi:NAD dependent epimerase/dehydratase family enzyme
LEGPVNLVAPNPARNKEFTKVLAQVLGRPALVPMPALVAKALFGQMAEEALLASARVEPGGLAASGFVFRDPELRPALERLLGR